MWYEHFGLNKKNKVSFSYLDTDELKHSSKCYFGNKYVPTELSEELFQYLCCR